MLQLKPVGISTTLPTHQRPSGHIWQDMKDIKDISEKELTKLYAEYQAALGRPVPAVVHRQGRSIPGCVSAETSAAWRFANKPLEANSGIGPVWNITSQMAAIQMANATATTIQTKTRSRVLMRWPALYCPYPV